MLELLCVSVSAGIGFALFPHVVRVQGWCSAAWMLLVGLGMPGGDRVKLWVAQLEGELSGTAGDKAEDCRAEHGISDPSQSRALPLPATRGGDKQGKQ